MIFSGKITKLSKSYKSFDNFNNDIEYEYIDLDNERYFNVRMAAYLNELIQEGEHYSFSVLKKQRPEMRIFALKNTSTNEARGENDSVKNSALWKKILAYILPIMWGYAVWFIPVILIYIGFFLARFVNEWGYYYPSGYLGFFITGIPFVYLYPLRGVKRKFKASFAFSNLTK